MDCSYNEYTFNILLKSLFCLSSPIIGIKYSHLIKNNSYTDVWYQAFLFNK